MRKVLPPIHWIERAKVAHQASPQLWFSYNEAARGIATGWGASSVQGLFYLFIYFASPGSYVYKKH